MRSCFKIDYEEPVLVPNNVINWIKFYGLCIGFSTTLLMLIFLIEIALGFTPLLVEPSRTVQVIEILMLVFALPAIWQTLMGEIRNEN